MKAPISLTPTDEPTAVTTGPDPYALLARFALGQPHDRIARAMGLTVDEVRQWEGQLGDQLSELEESVKRRLIDSADVDVETMAKLAAPNSMRELIAMAEHCPDPKTRRVANRDVLEFAGAQPAKRVEVSSGDKLLDLMNGAELREFAGGVWPARFADQLRRIQVRNQLASGQGFIDVTPTGNGTSADEG